MTDLPVVPAPDEDLEDRKDVLGVVLAAGTSSRFGPGNKLLREIDGEPVVRHAVGTLSAARLEHVAVVVGHEAPALREAVAVLDVTVLANEDYAEGKSTAIRSGVAHVAEAGADAVVIALGDMPFVSQSSVNALVRAHEHRPETAFAAAFDGERGNPVLFDAVHFDELRVLHGDAGGRHVLREADAALVETGDPGVCQDIDTPGDAERTEDSGEDA